MHKPRRLELAEILDHNGWFDDEVLLDHYNNLIEVVNNLVESHNNDIRNSGAVILFEEE